MVCHVVSIYRFFVVIYISTPYIFTPNEKEIENFEGVRVRVRILILQGFSRLPIMTLSSHSFSFNVWTQCTYHFIIKECGLLREKKNPSVWLILIWFLVFNATFSNISAISWRPVLVVEEAGVPGENHRPWASSW